MRARIPSSRAAHATACPWLPALAATTPAARCSWVSAEMRLYAPRILNDPVRWRFSAFRCTSRPKSCDSVSERYTGVTRATPSRRERAASMSGSVGARSVAANSEHLLQDLTNSTQGVELTALHLVEQAAQLRIVCDGELQVAFCPRGCDREHLAREIAAAPLLELP